MKKSNPSLLNKTTTGKADPTGGQHIDIARRETGTKVRYDWKPSDGRGVREKLPNGQAFPPERSANDVWLKYNDPTKGAKKAR